MYFRNILLSCFFLLLPLFHSVEAQFVSVDKGGNYEDAGTWKYSQPSLNGVVNNTLTVNGIVNRTGDLWVRDGYVYGVLNVHGNFSHSQGSSFYVNDGGRLEVWGNLTSTARIYVEKGGTLIVHGNLTDYNWGSVFAGDVVVTGNVYMHNTSVYSTGKLVVGGDLTIPGGGGSYRGEIYLMDPESNSSIPSWMNYTPGNQDDFINNEGANSKLYDIVKDNGLIVERPFDRGVAANLVYWFRADQKVLGVGKVTQWGDLSGNRNHANSATDGPEPVVSQGLNGQKALAFQGSNQLSLTNNFRINSGVGYKGDQRSMFLVFRTGNDLGMSNPQVIYEQGGSSNGLSVFVRNGKLYVRVYNDGNSNNSKTLVANVLPATDYVLYFGWNQGILTGSLNGKMVDHVLANGSIISLKEHSGSISIGVADGATRDENGLSYSGSSYFQGQIAEMLYFDKLLSDVEVTDITGKLQERYNVVIGSDKIYYSYRSGRWDDKSTWTHDAGGTTQTAIDIPGEGAKVVLLNGRTIQLNADVNVQRLSLAIRDGAFLDMGDKQFVRQLDELSGRGTLRLASEKFPVVKSDLFSLPDGGTVEYVNPTNFQLPVSQKEYNNLVINSPGVLAVQLVDLTINGYLLVKRGTFQINDHTKGRRRLVIKGDLEVAQDASMVVGTGDTRTGNLTGGLAPFLNYYVGNTHTVHLEGNFTNFGRVRFTNQSHPVYNTFPADGAATVFFSGSTNNRLTCQGTSDFYNIIVDKGNDATHSLTLYSSEYRFFRLFGRNDLSIDGGEYANPNMRKALWVRNGTLILQGLVVVPSLTEGSTAGTPGSDYCIPSNASVLLDGSEVVVLTTADDYREVNAAYGLSQGVGLTNGVVCESFGSALSVFGRLQVNDGYLSTRESGGIVYHDLPSASLVVNGGVIDTKQFKAAQGKSGLISFSQTDGTIILRGRFQRVPPTSPSVTSLVNAAVNTTHSSIGWDPSKGAFNMNHADNVYAISGGTMQFLDAGANGNALDIFSSAKNINVTGGIVEFLPYANSSDFFIRSNASIGSLVIRKTTGVSKVMLASSGSMVSGNLSVLKDIRLQGGIFDAKGFNVALGGDLVVSSGSSYLPGNNSTIFNGAGKQALTVDLAAPLSLFKLRLDKPSGQQLVVGGTQQSIVVSDSLTVIDGVFNDNGHSIYVSGNIYHAGVHIGNGGIYLDGVGSQSIGGNGHAVFQNLALYNQNADVKVKTNIKLQGVLLFGFDDCLLDMGVNNLTFLKGSQVVNYGSKRYIKTAGNAGDGGVSVEYSSTGMKLFPLGVTSYTPASLGFITDPDAYGTVTVVPVNYVHPVAANSAQALKYFWRVKSSGFDGYEGKVSHSFGYDQAFVVGDERNYIPVVYDGKQSSWALGESSGIDIQANKLMSWVGDTDSHNFLDGDYSAGVSSAFQKPVKFYSRQSGLWRDPNSWSITSHSGPAVSRKPGLGDVVVIGKGHIISLQQWNNAPDGDKQACASLQIETGGVLDVSYNPGSNLGMVLNHPNGNGLIRVGTAYNTGSVFYFPKGDFSDFNSHMGSTELYTINAESGTTYWLPNGITEYGNLIISPKGGSNIIFPNNDVVVYGNLTTNGQNADSWFSPAWNSDYPQIPRRKIAKTITVKGNLYVKGGSLYWYGNGSVAQNILVDGDVVVDPGAGIGAERAFNQKLEIGGSLINNSSGRREYSVSTKSQCDFSAIPVRFFGERDALITNTAGNPITTFSKLMVDKGTSQKTTLTVDIKGSLVTPDDAWLELKNGTFSYKRDGLLRISNITPFAIPSTSGLFIDTKSDVVLAYGNSDDNDVYLNGKFTLINGRVFVGSASYIRNNDIEFSGGGASEIDVQGGELFVNGQIRRNPGASSGNLKYYQTNGKVTINGQNALKTNGKLEVLNTGSVFNMSGGELVFIRGGGGNTFSDLYLRPEKSTVTGGEIIFTTPRGVPSDYLLDSNVALHNLTVKGDYANSTVCLMNSALRVNGDLLLDNGYSILDANKEMNVDVSIGGNFIHSGIYNYYENTTSFDGSSQSISGSSEVSFYNLIVTPIVSLSLSKAALVKNDLIINRGALNSLSYLVSLLGDLTNNASYVSDDKGGILLCGAKQQLISGKGAFSRLVLDNRLGAKTISDISMVKDLVLANGIFNINRNLLVLGEQSNILSANSQSAMVVTNGVYSNKGIKKVFPTGSSDFVFPLGVDGKFTPVELKIKNNTQVASIRINNVNSNHPGVLDRDNVLGYFWEVESVGLDRFDGMMIFNYVQDDVRGDDASYFSSRLLTPGTAWSKIKSVDHLTNKMIFNFNGANELGGEYTAGQDKAFPSNVPQYKSVRDGDWSDRLIWEQTGGDDYPCPAGGPNGFIVSIDHRITADVDFCQAYKTTVLPKGKLLFPVTHYGHNLGNVSGSGTLFLESGQLPEGKYDEFLNCSNSSTIEFGGDGDYLVVADLFKQVPRLVFSGTGRRVLPDTDITVCHELLIDGPLVDNGVYNRGLYLKGLFTLHSGGFRSGSGKNALVSFAGDSEQCLSGFKGENALFNLEINNINGVSLKGKADVKGNLLLTRGVLKSTKQDLLTIVNTANECVSPASGYKDSYVDGPMAKVINQGDYFAFPIGSGNSLGDKLKLLSVQSGVKTYMAEYVKPNTTYQQFDKIDPITGLASLTAVNKHEFWRVSSDAVAQAIIQLSWDGASDITPAMTEHGLDDIRIANFNGNKWIELSSKATGNNSQGVVKTLARHAITVEGANFTTATVNTNKPKLRLNPVGPVCDLFGIPVDISSTVPAPLNYTLKYTIDDVEQTAISITKIPFVLPTPRAGVYQLQEFYYANGNEKGVVDLTPVQVFQSPSQSDAGSDQSLKGESIAKLNANRPLVGVGVWSIVSGDGGAFENATRWDSRFIGVSGNSYKLRWTITNGACESDDEVSINFPFSSYLWEGNVSSEWDNVNNWRGKLIPNKDADVLVNHSPDRFNPEITRTASVKDLLVEQGSVTVKAGAKMTVEGDLLVSIKGKLVLENDLANRPASFILRGTSSGNVIVKNSYPTLARNWYIGIPVKTTSDDVFSAGGFSMWSYAHSSTSESWTTETSGKSYRQPGRGFIVCNGSGVSKTIEHKGELYFGSQSLTLVPNAKHRWNLVANPFNGYINPRKLDFSNIEKTIWYRTVVDNTYQFVTYNQQEDLVLPYKESVLIAPMQAFWVRVVQDGDLVFNVDALTHPSSDNPKLKNAMAPVRDVLYLQLVNDMTSDQTAIACRMTGHMAFTNSDSEKKLSGGVVPNIYSVKGGKYTAINIQPEEPDPNGVQLGYSLGKGANNGLKFKVLNIDDFMPELGVYLEDRTTGVRIDLRAHPEYVFTSDPKTDNSRFVLKFEKISTGIEDDVVAEQKGERIRIYGQQDKAIVLVGSELLRQGNARVNIYNLAGSLMSTHEVSDTRSEITLPAAPAIYLVEVEAGGQVKREKVVK